MSPLFFVSLVWTLAFGKAVKDWCYEGPDCGPATWGGECQTGAKQSPIDLPFNTSVQPRSAHLYQNFEYFNNQDFFAVNNGHTVEVSLSQDLTSTAMIDGSVFPRGDVYIFDQLHFHWGSFNGRGSEHTLNYQNFSMEAHLVHYREDFKSLQDAIASNETDALVVMGTFFNVSSNAVDNDALKPIVQALSSLSSQTTLENFPGANLNLSLFYPQKGKQELIAVQYEGSLTTPSCSQVVLWNVFIETASMSQKQMELFRSLKIPDMDQPLGNNVRPIQDRNSRPFEAVGINVLRPH